MSHIVLEIVLSKGKWSYHPSPRRVRRKLEQVFENSLLAVTFDDPDDSAIEAEIGIEGHEDACEGICDTIFRAFLEWKPEYESMIEVGIAFMGGPSDDPFEYGFHDGDNNFDRIERIWR
ncbi:MAG: hypothetical protein KJZ78_13015 [Bryobacteraceae bacterium]|nr:hypothetical protein [Bryobacteraceae bacterium]